MRVRRVDRLGDEVRGEPGLADPGIPMDEHHVRRELTGAELRRRPVCAALAVGRQRVVDLPLMPRVDVEQLVREHDLIPRELALEHALAHVLEVLGDDLLLHVRAPLEPGLPTLGVDPEVVRPTHRSDLRRRVLVLVRVLHVRQIRQHVVVGVPPAARLLDVLGLDADAEREPIQRCALRTAGELDDRVQVIGLRLDHQSLLRVAPDLALVLVMHDAVGLDDLAAGGLEPLHHVGEDRFGSLLEQRGPVRVLGSPGPVRRIEVLREPDARRVVLLLSHGDHPRRGQRGGPQRECGA